MRRSIRLWISALLAMGLSACAMGPDYRRPDLPIPESYRMAASAQETQSIANLPWWQLLQDEELQKLVRIALEENKDLQQAAAVVEEFQARLGAGEFAFSPQLTVSANAPFGKLHAVTIPRSAIATNYYIQGNLTWELDIWGRIRRSNEAARADLLAQEENRRAVILELVSSVAQSYFDLRQLDLQLEIAKNALQSWEESAGIAKARLRQGVTSRLDADQFEAERANAAARSAELTRQIAQKESELSVLLGRNPSQIPRGRPLTEQKMPPEVPAGLPSELLQRRPDILQSEEALAAATARIGIAKASRFPTISLTGVLGVASPQLVDLGKGDFGSIGVGLVAPILNARTLGYEQQVAEAQARQVLALYEKTVLFAFKEVEDALVAVRTSQEQSKAQEVQVEALQSALHLAEVRYQGGISNYLDVLTAKRNLFDAQLALTATRRLHLASIVQLYKALGGGWTNEGRLR
ncbi:MAG: efflux transporter outer membrane subunit [Nitrospirae bacterium]|nr:efflux transporter outer membrane subunit [Candidatus Manganitrophaceae bacterium]